VNFECNLWRWSCNRCVETQNWQERKFWSGVFFANEKTLQIRAVVSSSLISIGVISDSIRRLLIGVVRGAPKASLKAAW